MKPFFPLSRQYLAAFVTATLSPLAAAADSVPIVVNGDIRTIPSGTYTYTADAVVGLTVLGGGRAFGRDIDIVTSGGLGNAVDISGSNSFVELIGGTLSTKGDSAHAVRATNTGMAGLLLQNVSVVTEGAGARGIQLDRASGKLRAGSVETSGHNAVGVEVKTTGSVSLEGTSVITRGDEAQGVRVDQASSMESDGATIHTNGRGSHGVLIGQGNATATLVRTEVTTSGPYANAIHANQGSGLVTVTANSKVRTEGLESIAVIAHDGAPVAVRDSFLETLGRHSHAVFNHGSFVGLENADVVTRGHNAHGVFARGGQYAGRVPFIDVRNSRIVTHGMSGYGAVASTGARVSLVDTTIRTTGEAGHGLYVTQAELTSRDTAISTEGEAAYGALVQNRGSLIVDGGSVSSAHAAALRLHDPGSIHITGGAVLSGGNGAFAEVDPDSADAFAIVLDGKSQAVGDIRLLPSSKAPASDDTKLSLAIKGSAVWSGASSIVRALSIEDGGMWIVTADSHVAGLRNDHGVIAFSPAAPGAFGTLTITGDYAGEQGLFRMRSRLGDDTSATDRIHVMGNTSGTSFISVDALDGAGDNTADGIQLVRVDGRSEGQFELSGRAVAGAHEYFLHQGSISQPGDGGWYLRSSLSNPILAPEEGEDIDDPVMTPVPVLRPETGTYRANQTAALDMFQSGPGGGWDDEPESSRGSAWARFQRRHTAFDLGRQVTTTTSSNELTLGSDILRSSGSAEGHVGVMAAVGQSDTRGTSIVTRYSARGRVRGAAAGMYGGFRTAAGTYLRGWSQYAHFNQRVEGQALAHERYGTGALTTSVEAGHRWRRALNRDTDAYLEPQAQLVATRLRGGTHIEANGTRVAPRHASGSTSRLGLRAAARWQTPGGHVASPYVTGSWLRRLGRLDATQFDETSLAGGVPRNAYALKLGLSIVRNDGWRLWSDVESRFGVRRYRRMAGTVGVRTTW
ncbi:autotransporter outer membrane beta-barrel domain-containing protein [Luteibacter sp. SG786]|uniref:autotransporter family protein n=1 Tax=Luteibacter sp. SG786 TaxID=2587130 RepID=UPI00141F492D|nr:autotransporter outer membrane beta-barrel domain-containing protein [Luteibacter sp. SG786]NII52768.1 autotransporter family porin [Luteibacter sp. SG786]